MKIRKEQMEAFEQVELTKFETRIADFLQTQFPDAKEIPLKDLMPVIHEQVACAHSYGLETEQQIVNYVTTAWLLGQEFDREFPAAQEKLSSNKYSADDKSEWLVLWTKKMFTSLDGGK